MPATLGTINTEETWTTSTIEAVLKEYFLSPLYDTINREVDLLKAFQKAIVEWSGKRAIVPVRISRNTGVGSAAENGALPTATNQGTDNLNVYAAYVYGTFEVTGPAEAAGENKGIGSLINVLEFEMEGVQDDLKNYCDTRMWSGRRCVGFLNEHKDGAPAATWDFSGDGTRLNELITESAAPDIIVVRGDTYATVATTTITSVNIAAGSVVIVGAVDTTAVANGIGCMLLVTEASLTNANEPQGVYGNLSEPTHFGLARTAGNFTTLRSNILTVAVAGAHDRTALTTRALHRALSEVRTVSGEDIDELWSHENLRQEYYSLATGSANSIAFDPKTGATKIDMGATDMTFSGKPWRTSRHCGTGLIFFSNRESWAVAELGKFKLANIDGKTLQRVANRDAVGGYVRWYYQLVCKSPNRNAILCGIDFTGAL